VDEGDFMRCGTLDVNRDRESAAIGDRHDPRALPALRLPTPAPPCFAAAKLPSMKVSCRSR
jgi:hypothetical protein